jgi:hypothetical protein
MHSRAIQHVRVQLNTYTFDSTRPRFSTQRVCVRRNSLSVRLDMSALGGAPLGSGRCGYVGLLWALTRQWQQQRWSLDALCGRSLVQSSPPLPSDRNPRTQNPEQIFFDSTRPCSTQLVGCSNRHVHVGFEGCVLGGGSR